MVTLTQSQINKGLEICLYCKKIKITVLHHCQGQNDEEK